MHPGAVGRTREERIAQVRAAQDPTLHDDEAYVPVGNVVAKLRRWQHQGAQMDYLSSHRNPEDVAKDAAVLRRYGFPAGRVLARQPGQSYGQVAARELPDILIEDDCESIGAEQLTYPQIPADLGAASSPSSSPSSAASITSPTAYRTCWLSTPSDQPGA